MAGVIGLDIGTSAVRAVELTPGRRGVVRLDRVGQVQLEHGVVRDGEIAQPDAMTEALRLLWRTYGFKNRKVALGVANQQVVVRQIELPYLPEAELRKSLAFQVQDFIPLAVDQAVLDFHLLGESVQDEDQQQRSNILLVAAQRQMISELVGVVQAARLQPVSIDLDAFAVLRALSTSEVLPTGEGELLLDVGASVTNLVVHDAGSPRFVRILLMGGGAITESLVGSLGITADEAEYAKATVGLATDQIQVLENDRARLITERATRFVEEIRSSVDYYSAQPGAVPIRRALLAGGAGQLPNLRERLSETLRVPVDYARPLSGVVVGKTAPEEEQLLEAEPFLTVGIGLALGALS